MTAEEKRKEYQREWYQKNKAKKAEQKRKNRAANREEYNEYNREYAKTWRESNKEHWLSWKKDYENTESGRASKLCSNYKSDDRIKSRGECDLTTEWVLGHIVKSSCVYCGESDYLKLGCDRIDNNLPHTQENCVCACWDCNNDRQKKGMSVEEYIKYKKEGN